MGGPLLIAARGGENALVGDPAKPDARTGLLSRARARPRTIFPGRVNKKLAAMLAVQSKRPVQLFSRTLYMTSSKFLGRSNYEDQDEPNISTADSLAAADCRD